MASEFWLIVGLGNPGAKYRNTRHNMGFMTVNELAKRWSIHFANHKGLADLGKGTMSLNGQTAKVFLCKPLTYMNDSGQAVQSIREYYHINLDHIVVIHDDMDLEFGRIKLKSGGSAGGHNGIKSIDRCLHSPDYARVRMGVGHASRSGDDQLGARRIQCRTAQATSRVPCRRCRCRGDDRIRRPHESSG